MNPRNELDRYITISPNIQGGMPVFKSTRVPVKNLFDYLKGGDNLEEFLDSFPSVNKEAALKVLELAEYYIEHSGNEAAA